MFYNIMLAGNQYNRCLEKLNEKITNGKKIFEMIGTYKWLTPFETNKISRFPDFNIQ